MPTMIYCIGNVTADVYHQPNSEPVQIQHAPVGNLTYYLGGIATNVAVGLSQFELPVSLIAKLGPDQLGENLLAMIHQSQITYDIPRSTKPTSIIVVNPKNEDHDVTYDAYSQGTAYSDLHPEDLPTITTSDDIIVVSSTIYSHHNLADTFMGQLQIYRSQQTLVVLDLNIRHHHDCDVLRYRNYTKYLIQSADLIKGTLEEYQWVYQINSSSTQDESLAMLQEYLSNDKLYIITLGEGGCIFYQRGSFYTVPSTPVHVPNDLVGAGDSFLVGCLAKYVSAGMSLNSLLTDTAGVTAMCHCGNQVARVIIQHHGSTGYSVMDTQKILENPTPP